MRPRDVRASVVEYQNMEVLHVESVGECVVIARLRVSQYESERD